MSDFVVRKACVTDAERIASLSGELGYPVEVEEIQQRLERLLPQPEHFVIVVESSSAGVVGWTHATEQDFVETDRHVEIVGLVVASDQRGHGVGRLLISAIEKWAAERGLKKVA